MKTRKIKGHNYKLIALLALLSHQSAVAVDPEISIPPKDAVTLLSESDDDVPNGGSSTTVPSYSSMPGSPNTIYLDFDGEVVTGTNWNTKLNDSSLKCFPLDRDGDRSTFNASELNIIYNTWYYVAQRYALFNVNVTTQRPAVINDKVVHCIITPTTGPGGQRLPHTNKGGVASLNGWYKPADDLGRRMCFVDTGAVSWNGRSICHETSHVFGVSHRGYADDTGFSYPYYLGHHDGQGGGPTPTEVDSNIWGAMIGFPVGRNPFAQWSDGSYTGAASYDGHGNPVAQSDDITIIGNALGYKADDYGGDIINAGSLSVISGKAYSAGILGANLDKDCMRFFANTGKVSLTAIPGLRMPGLQNLVRRGMDLKLELRNVSGVVVAKYGSRERLDAALVYDNPVPQNLYLTVSGDSVPGYNLPDVKPYWLDAYFGIEVPKANQTKGYPGYGSVGYYYVEGVIP